MSLSNDDSKGKRQRKHVALIGSSGGGTATFGHTDADSLLQTIHEHLTYYDIALTHACYIAALYGKGMDHVDAMKDKAILYTVSHDMDSGKLACSEAKKGTLQSVNDVVLQNFDESLAKKISSGDVDALICISCCPPLFPKTLEAVSAAKIPVTGSGGTSLSQLSCLFDIHLVGNAGGSVATTTYSRAVSYSSALAQYWNRERIEKPGHQEGTTTYNELLNLTEFRSVLNASLPVFWSCCLLRFALERLQELPVLDSGRKQEIQNMIQVLSTYPLPAVCAVTMAQNGRFQSNKESVLAASILVSVLVCKNSILSGLLAGWMVRTISRPLMSQCVQWNVPATMTTLLATGLTTVLVALTMVPVMPVLCNITEVIRHVIAVSTKQNPWVGFLWGMLVCHGSKVGWYHSIILPLILIEMEKTEASFLGAVDELALVLVCAGVCSAQLVFDHKHSLCRRGFFTNVLYGDFVEACYPYMDSCPWTNASCYIASGISCAVLATNGLPRSMAYLPVVCSVMLAWRDWRDMAIAACIAFFVPFFVSIGMQAKHVVFKTRKPKYR